MYNVCTKKRGFQIMENVINKFKDIIKKFGYEVVDLQSCSEQQLKYIIKKNGSKIKRILIIKRK